MRMQTSIEIARPDDEVIAVVSDVSRNPERQDGMISATRSVDPVGEDHCVVMTTTVD